MIGRGKYRKFEAMRIDGNVIGDGQDRVGYCLSRYSNNLSGEVGGKFFSEFGNGCNKHHSG